MQKGNIVLVTGGTGFVGRHVTNSLLKSGFRVRQLRRSLGGASKYDSDLESHPGDILDAGSLSEAACGCDAVVHLVGIIREIRRKEITFQRIHVEGTRKVVDAANKAGISTFIHMSANGADKNGKTEYQTSKWQAEEIVRSAGFEHCTIFRPSVIFGKPGPGCEEFGSQLIGSLIKPFPVWPVFGKGDYRLQPIAVENIAEAFTQAMLHRKFSGKTYCAGGPERLPYVEILDILARAIDMKPRPKIFHPVWLMRSIISALAPTGMLPITPEQFEMLLDGNTCNDRAFQDDFDIDLIPFEPQTLSYLKEKA